MFSFVQRADYPPPLQKFLFRSSSVASQFIILHKWIQTTVNFWPSTAWLRILTMTHEWRKKLRIQWQKWRLQLTEQLAMKWQHRRCFFVLLAIKKIRYLRAKCLWQIDWHLVYVAPMPAPWPATANEWHHQETRSSFRPLSPGPLTHHSWFQSHE